jgi:NADH-quinone oxidoreductase subunit M
LVLFSLLAAAVILAAPKRDLAGGGMSGILLVAAGTSVACAAETVAGMATGWWVATLGPWLVGAAPERRDVLALVLQVVACAALTGAAWLTGFGEHGFAGAETMVFGLLMAAVVVRKGVYPFHSWVLDAFDRGPLLGNTLLFNGHLGAMILLRAEATPLEASAARILDGVTLAALGTAVVATVAAIGQRRPRRILALLGVSQAAFILAGLGSRNVEGITGALTHWLVVSVATTGLACVLRAVEARRADVGSGEGFLGLAERTPWLAAAFLVCGLSLVGLPGTLGYCAEDLLYHGALGDHPVLGVALLVATALNAIHLLRLYSHLFLGRRGDEVPAVEDAKVRERWAVGACVLFLVGTGLVPGGVVAWRAAAAERLAEEPGPGAGHASSGDSSGSAGRKGTETVTVHPVPGDASIASEPPHSRARARMPTKPRL